VRSLAQPELLSVLQGVDVRVSFLAIAATLVAGVAAAAWPTRVLWRAPQSGLRSRSVWAGVPGERGLRRVVAIQAALTTMLALGGAVFSGAAVRLGRMDRGFETSGVAFARVSFPDTTGAIERTNALYAALSLIGDTPGTFASAGGVPVPGAVGDFDAIELNEAFASQALAVMRALGLPDDAEHVNANGGAIALGHPLGMSGARIAGTVVRSLVEKKAKRGLATMCVGVRQGVSVAFERV
jgi:hypothetical protein